MDPQAMQRMQQMMEAQREEDNMAVTKVLTESQLNRLEQVRLQIVGPLAVAEFEVAQKLSLQEEQFAQIQEIIDSMDQEMTALAQAGMEQMRTEFMRQNPPGVGNGGAGRARGGAPVQADPNADPEGDAAAKAQADNAQRGAQNNQRMQAMAEQATKMAEQQDQLTGGAEAAVAKILTKRQKTNFNSMLGKEFDLKKLLEENQGGRGPGGGRRGQPGDPAQAPGGQSPPPSANQNAGGGNAPGAGEDPQPSTSKTRTRPQPRVRGQAPTTE